MTPEQMRELADALEPMAAAPRFDGLPVAEFCAWLRQCAEQRPARDWAVIDAAIREYLSDYEMLGETDTGADAYYTPTERERDLIYDAINGLLGDEQFIRLLAAAPVPPQREEAQQYELNRDEVICPKCVHQFRAIPENVQKRLAELEQREPLSDEPPQQFAAWVRANIPPSTIISNPEWWIPRLWRAAVRSIGGSDE